MSSFLLNILSPMGLAYEGEVASMYAPSSAGPLGILPGHTPLIASINPKGGLLYIEDDNGKKMIFAVASGAIEVKKEKTIVLTERAESVSNEEAGKEALVRFGEYIKKKQNVNDDVRKAEAKLASAYSLDQK